MNRIEQITETLKKHDAYSKVLSWDKNLKQPEGVEWILGKMFAGYQDDELMILGIITRDYTSDMVGILSIFKNPKLTDEMLEQELLSTMTNYAKENMNIEKASIVQKIVPKVENNKSLISTLRMKRNNKKGV